VERNSNSDSDSDSDSDEEGKETRKELFSASPSLDATSATVSSSYPPPSAPTSSPPPHLSSPSPPLDPTHTPPTDEDENSWSDSDEDDTPIGKTRTDPSTVPRRPIPANADTPMPSHHKAIPGNRSPPKRRNSSEKEKQLDENVSQALTDLRNLPSERMSGKGRSLSESDLPDVPELSPKVKRKVYEKKKEEKAVMKVVRMPHHHFVYVPSPPPRFDPATLDSFVSRLQDEVSLFHAPPLPSFLPSLSSHLSPSVILFIYSLRYYLSSLSLCRKANSMKSFGR